MTDLEIQAKGFKTLVENLGIVEAERFITLTLREPFDYTAWQKDLYQGLSVDEISNLAMQHRNAKNATQGSTTSGSTPSSKQQMTSNE